MNHATFALLLLTATAAAQGGRIVPAQFDYVEGNARHTYPFGRADAQMQILANASELNATQGFIQSLLFRADGVPANSYPAYVKGYKLTVTTTPVAAAQMTIDPVANRGAAPGTVAFNGPLNVPASGPVQPVPRAFGLRLAFASPYMWQSAQGNLLLHVETTDLVAPPGSYTLDAANLSTIQAQGVGGPVSPGCRAGTDELRLTVAHAGATVGGALVVTPVSTRAGAFPLAFFILGFTNQDPWLPLDLTALGMPNCAIDVEMFFTLALSETGGTYPVVRVPIPGDPALAYMPLYTQGFGWALPSVSFAGSVTSAAYVTLIGEAQPAAAGFQSIFYVASQSIWSMSGNGIRYAPVFLLEGLFL